MHPLVTNPCRQSFNVRISTDNTLDTIHNTCNKLTPKPARYEGWTLIRRTVIM